MGSGSCISRSRAVAVLAASLSVAGCGASRGGVEMPAQAARLAHVTAAPASTPTPTPSAGRLTRTFDAVYHRYASELLGMCVGAIDVRTQAIKCYGKTARGSAERPGRGTLFQIGSISKTFTGTLLALRMSDGTAHAEDPVKDYVPPEDGSAHIPAAMTLLDLADHRAGLPRSTPGGSDVSSVDDYFARIARCEQTHGCPVGKPGGPYLYSNFAFGVLGEALGRRDGYAESTYSEWEQDNDASITVPLGMTDTHSWFGWKALAPGAFDQRRARTTTGDPPREERPPYFPPAPYADPAGGLYSSAPDMLKWTSYSMGLSGTPALAAARPYLYDTARLVRPRDDPPNAHQKVGLAWNIQIHGRGRAATTCVAKYGTTRGFSAYVVFVKHHSLGAFVLLNSIPDSPDTPSIGTDLINSLPWVSRAKRHATVCDIAVSGN